MTVLSYGDFDDVMILFTVNSNLSAKFICKLHKTYIYIYFSKYCTFLYHYTRAKQS